jgi:hypothetical protein
MNNDLVEYADELEEELSHDQIKEKRDIKEKSHDNKEWKKIKKKIDEKFKKKYWKSKRRKSRASDKVKKFTN